MTHPGGCPFITFDGDDLFLILDGRVTLPEVIRRKPGLFKHWTWAREFEWTR